MSRSDTEELPAVIAGRSHGVRLRRYPGEQVCGDAVACWQSGRRQVMCIADGLGHGPEAAIASDLAIDYVGAHLDEEIASMLRGCDVALRTTRGAAVGIAIVEGGQLSYGGIGNTRALRVGVQSCRFSSDAGIVGGGYRRLIVEVVPIEHGDLVVLFTDGLTERLEVPASLTLGNVDTEVLAGELLDAWATGRDDAGVLVYQHREDL